MTNAKANALSGLRWTLIAAALAWAGTAAASAQTAVPTTVPAAPLLVKSASMEKLSDVWVDGPGFDITYGKAYDVCAQRCLANATCKMIEYYRPQKKCNMYSAERPRLKGGDSEVAVRR